MAERNGDEVGTIAISRREFLAGALAAPIALLQSGARFVSNIPLGVAGGGTAPPFGRLLARGLDARLFTDLSTLSPDKPDTLVTPNQRFFVRTAAPAALGAEGWKIHVGGLVDSPMDVGVPTLASMAPLRNGRYLIECSGNVDQSNYGLMSTADWEGVPLARVLDRVRPAVANHRILVSGLDDPVSAARTSVPGASWIFARADLERALLALRMNGEPLPRDHGAPVRLVVPGWYGCACIKWVNRVDLVADEAEATTQMREFAARTHQPFDSREIASSLRAGRPLLAREFEAAVIDTAAMPVRVEKWAADGRIFYRVIGIVWGGAQRSAPWTDPLVIRFKSGEPWVRVEHSPVRASAFQWEVWSHTWRPSTPGRYQIVLKVDDPKLRTRRLDVFFYVRDVDIDAV